MNGVIKACRPSSYIYLYVWSSLTSLLDYASAKAYLTEYIFAIHKDQPLGKVLCWSYEWSDKCFQAFSPYIFLVLEVHLPHTPFLTYSRSCTIPSDQPVGSGDGGNIVSWEPEGRYRCTKSMAIVPFWFSVDDMVLEWYKSACLICTF